MTNSTSRARLRRLAIPTLVVAMITGTTGVAASAAPGDQPATSGPGYFSAGSDRTVTLTDGNDRRPGGADAANRQAARARPSPACTSSN